MSYVIRFIQIFAEPIQRLLSGDYELLDIWTLVFRFGMLICTFTFVFCLLKYCKDYRIFEGLAAKLKGDVQAYDRIKRSQIRTKIEANNDAFTKQDKKSNLIDKLYLMVAHTGIAESIPGFSEMGLLIVMGVLAFIIFVVMTCLRSFVIGLLMAAAFLVVSWYILDLIAYNRKIKMEKQLLQFTNACASASLQYSNIIDIFGAVYDQFSSPLREGLEACYVEAKSTNDKLAALKHLKERYDSTQFSFIIDNLELCSSVTGDYHATAKDVSETIAIYSASHEKKRVLLRNAKVNIVTMFVIALGILYALSMFVGGIQGIMFNSTVGNILTIALVLLFFYGLNIKAEK